MSEIFLQNEDNLNSILVNFKNLLKSFATLSRDKIENILLNANSMIKEGENNLRIMEEEINKLGIQQQFNNKLKNYKLEFQNLQNKFQESQEEYINHKANNAISLGRNENTEELNNQNNELISNNENILIKINKFKKVILVIFLIKFKFKMTQIYIRDLIMITM